jgi:hypothetical protein
VTFALLARAAGLAAALAAGEARAHDPCGPGIDDGWVLQRLRASGEFEAVLAAAAAHRLQILITEVRPGPDGRRALVSHGLRVDAEYFYPASAIKTFAAVAAMRALGDAPLATPLALCERGARRCTRTRDPSNRAGGRITIGHEIRKMQIVSDNGAFNRLYDFVGHRALNESLTGLGFASLRIHHRLSTDEPAGAQRSTPGAELRPQAGPRREVPARTSDLRLAPHPAGGTAIGAGFLVDGSLVPGPMDFADKNGASLCDLQRLTLALTLPDEGPALGLSPAQRGFLVEAMTVDPHASDNPRYTDPAQAVARFKPMLPGLERTLPRARIRYVNKAGKAYGFHVENAYVEDRASGRAALVTATIYADADGVLDDDRYDYATVTAPFYAALGAVVGRALVD